MSNVVYTKIGKHRGRPRLWLEGQRLTSQGIEPGQRYDVEFDTERTRIMLRIKPDGERVVSRRRRGDEELPIIDLSAEEMRILFGPVERVRVLIKATGILVTLHHHDTAARERFDRLLRKLAAGEALDVGSLAHGGGVLDHAIHTGLARANVPSRLAWAVEVDGRYLDVSQRNNPVWDAASVAIEAPMEEVEVGRLRPVEILLAGLPCTGASLAGRAKNGLRRAEEHETAGPLFVTFLNVIQATNPAVVVLENVPQYVNTASMTVIRSVLELLGYEIHERVLEQMGSLEDRKRLCMVATTKGVAFDLDAVKPIREKEACIQEVMEEVPVDSPLWRSFDYLDAKEVRDRAAGKGFRRQILRGTEPACGVIGRGYNKGRSTEPFVAHPTDGSLQRLFTVAEHARLKTIPEQLVEGTSNTVAHEILGQSVIHCAFEAVGQAIGTSLCQALEESYAAAA